MRTKKFTLITIITGLVFFAISCNKNDSATNPAASSTVSLYLTDDPSIVFDNLFLDIEKVEVKAEDSAEAKDEREHADEHSVNDKNGSTAGGWINIAITPGIYDLLKFRNGLDTVLGSVNFPGDRKLKKIRITLGPNNTGVINGVSFPFVLQDKNNVLVISLDDSTAPSIDGHFHISIDVDASESVHKNGNGFELVPHAKTFDRTKAGSIEGTVLPSEANALVFAINGTDTASAMPGAGGKFKFVGLANGTYKILFHPNFGNYRDSSMNVIVADKQNTHMQAVTLRK